METLQFLPMSFMLYHTITCIPQSQNLLMFLNEVKLVIIFALEHCMNFCRANSTEEEADVHCKENLDLAIEADPNNPEAYHTLASYWLSKSDKQVQFFYYLTFTVEDIAAGYVFYK